MGFRSTLANRNRSRLLFGAGVIAVAVCGFASQALGSFGAATDFAAGDGPQSVAIGDLNGDGKPDLAVANKNSGNVSVLLGDGTGSFGAPNNFGAGTNPYSVKIGKLNADGFPDLVVANFQSSDVSVLLGDGNGSFGTATNFPSGTLPWSVTIANLNGDGFPDLVTADLFSDSAVILLGDGTGSFGAPTFFAAGAGPRVVATGNLNGDGFPDLAVASYTSGVEILLGDGTGSFGAATNFAAGTSPFSIAAGKLNGDAFLDLAVANDGSNDVSVLFGDGTGSFGAPTNIAVGSDLNPRPRSVAIGDLDGDTNPDIATGNNGSGNVSVLLGDGTGAFGAATNFAVGAEPRSVAIGDLDSDSNLDLAVANDGSDNVSILLNSGPTTTAAPASLAFPSVSEGTTSASQTVVVANSSGGDPLVVSGASVAGTNAGDFAVVGQTCSVAPIPLSGTCDVQVTFTPSAAGVRSANLEVRYDGGASPLSVPLGGVGLDATAPDTKIDSGPTGTIATNRATFTFSGIPVIDTARIQCRIDDAAFTDCTSPKTFSGLSDGPHTASFRAADSAGNKDASPATRTFTVDTTVARITKVAVKGPAKVKMGKKAAYKVKIVNSGNAPASGVRLKVSGRGVSFNTTVGKIAAGKSRTVRVKIKPKKPGKVRATFKVTSSNAGGKTVKKTIKVKWVR